MPVPRVNSRPPHFPTPVSSGMLRGRMAPPETTTATPELSAVVPAYNEVESLPQLLTELRAALDATGRTWELVLVDDGSTDGSGELLAAEAARDPRLVVLRFEKNAGQSAALAAGLSRARGDAVV